MSFTTSISSRTRSRSTGFQVIPSTLRLEPTMAPSANWSNSAALEVRNPVLTKTGFRTSNAAELLQFADGAIVGSSLKVDGITWNPVERDRVRELMNVVNDIR